MRSATRCVSGDFAQSLSEHLVRVRVRLRLRLRLRARVRLRLRLGVKG